MGVARWLKSHIGVGKKMYGALRQKAGQSYKFIKKVQDISNKGMDLLHSLKDKAIQAGVPSSVIELAFDNPLVNSAESLVQYGNAVISDFDKFVKPSIEFSDRVISTGLNVGDELLNPENPSQRIDIRPIPRNEVRGSNVNGQVDRSSSNQFRSSMAAV